MYDENPMPEVRIEHPNQHRKIAGIKENACEGEGIENQRIEGRETERQNPAGVKCKTTLPIPQEKSVNISDLPKHHSGCQRGWVDDFLSGTIKEINGRKVLSAKYGHCVDYPLGFDVVLSLTRSEKGC